MTKEGMRKHNLKHDWAQIGNGLCPKPSGCCGITLSNPGEHNKGYNCLQKPSCKTHTFSIDLYRCGCGLARHARPAPEFAYKLRCFLQRSHVRGSVIGYFRCFICQTGEELDPGPKAAHCREKHAWEDIRNG